MIPTVFDIARCFGCLVLDLKEEEIKERYRNGYNLISRFMTGLEHFKEILLPSSSASQQKRFIHSPIFFQFVYWMLFIAEETY